MKVEILSTQFVSVFSNAFGEKGKSAINTSKHCKISVRISWFKDIEDSIKKGTEFSFVVSLHDFLRLVFCSDGFGFGVV